MIGIRPYDRRILDRKRVMFVATVEQAERNLPVRVVDVSPTGAKLEGKGISKIGADVELHRNGKTFRGCIVWENRDRAGVEFDELCDVPTLLRVMPEAKALSGAAWPAPLKPQVESAAQGQTVRRATFGTALPQ